MGRNMYILPDPGQKHVIWSRPKFHSIMRSLGFVLGAFPVELTANDTWCFYSFIIYLFGKMSRKPQTL